MYKTYTKTKCTKTKCIEDCCMKCDCYITDVISSKFQLRNKCFNTIWEGIKVNAAITIKIQNQSDCLLRLRIKDRKCYIIKIFPHQQRSITVQNVDNIALQCLCPSKDKFCFGCYEIAVHYISDLKRKRDRSFVCDEEYAEWYSIACIY